MERAQVKDRKRRLVLCAVAVALIAARHASSASTLGRIRRQAQIGENMTVLVKFSKL
jgi:uncharacterized protein YdbL (DUF1318 family)